MTFVNPAPYTPRDQWGHPLIKQPDGTTIPYMRTSVFAKSLDDGYGIMLWKLRMLAIGLGRREDLAAIAAGLTYEQKAQLDEIIDTALDFVGATAKANYGTAVHRFTEPGAPDFVPTRMQADVNAWNAALEREGIAVLATEQFVVNDLYRIAGTFDHILAHPVYGNVIGDKKTGALQFPFVAVQLGMYANSLLYNIETGQRTALPDINLDVGIAAHLPAGEGVCKLVPIDLRAGYLAAKTAAETRVWQAADFVLDEIEQAKRNLEKGGLVKDVIIAQIHATATVEALEEVWTLNRHAWTDRHNAAAAAHKHKLTQEREKAS